MTGVPFFNMAPKKNPVDDLYKNAPQHVQDLHKAHKKHARDKARREWKMANAPRENSK